MQQKESSCNVAESTDSLTVSHQEQTYSQLGKLTVNELTGLPTNNLDTERDFSKFSQLSEVARFRNQI